MPEEGQSKSYKIPISVLVVVYTADLEILLLEREQTERDFGSRLPGAVN